MEGEINNRGVNFRAIEELFNVIYQRKNDYSYDVTVSLLEIYNEKVRDLLVDRNTQR